ncbi:aminopeptidase P family protein [Candidatus Babeliales bacterium]|nr:aminopeptidase P family protein [Candidatus Babeliales bacterium]
MYKKRRKKLLKALHEKHPELSRGVVLLFADFENDKNLFIQESSFYYLTGVNEPGAVFCLYWDGREELFVPEFGKKREQWIASSLQVDPSQAGLSQVGLSVTVKKLGKPCASYSMKPFFHEAEYENLIQTLRDYSTNTRVGNTGFMFSLLDKTNDHYFFPIYRFKKISSELSCDPGRIVDISPIVHAMRRQKDAHEVSIMQRAIDITCDAHRTAAKIIRAGLYEYEVQAQIEAVFTSQKAQGIAFPSIVATGKNTTVLHYMVRDQKLCEGDLVVVDIGAQVGGYCADLTRTYPVSGEFTKRQCEVYELVLEVQNYVASLAKPGMFLVNQEKPEHSLHHLAVELLRERGYDNYFVHGIGHFLGLDVHDVGEMTIPLAVGDVFTIEPGIYIPQENIGIRIEDDFLITRDGCRCLSDGLVKNIDNTSRLICKLFTEENL